MFNLLHIIWLKLIQGIIVWVGICSLLESVQHLSRLFCLLGSPIVKSGVFLICLLLYITWSFPLQLLTFYLCFIGLVFWLLCTKEDSLFWFHIFNILYASCMLAVTSFFRLKKNSLNDCVDSIFLCLWPWFLLLPLCLLFLNSILS